MKASSLIISPEDANRNSDRTIPCCLSEPTEIFNMRAALRFPRCRFGGAPMDRNHLNEMHAQRRDHPRCP